MSSGIDTQFVQEMYEQMSNAELIAQVTTNASGLTPEALDIAKAELKKRGLSTRFSAALDVQNKPSYTVEEIDSYCSLLTGLHCPVCGSNANKLNATLTAEVMSFVVITHSKKKMHVACPDCLDGLNNAALGKTLALGWWGIPHGIIRTIQAIITNVKSKKSNHADGPNDYLRSFVLSNIGQLEAYRDSPSKLLSFIK